MTETPAPERVDRRSALKKAAAAGTIVWAAPTVLSSTAHAAEFIPGTPCTLKCTPDPVINFGADVTLDCQTNGAKWALLTFSVGSAGCPCAAGGSVVSLGSGVSPQPSEIKETTFDPASGTGTILIGGSGQGALGNGTYLAFFFFCVQCDDRSGDTLRRSCQTGVSFTFQPANGPCSQDANVGAAILQGTTCDPPECAAC